MRQPASSKEREKQFHQSKGGEGERRQKAQAENKPKADKATRRRYLREYRKWLWPYRWSLFTILVIALTTTALDMVWPIAIKQVMDHVLVNNTAERAQRVHQLLRIGGLIIAVLVLKQVLDSTRS